jgi:hypothetical protein
MALLEMISSGWMTQALYVAARLGIADVLAQGPKGSVDLAGSLGVHADSLHRLLRALTALGVCAERHDGVFELAPLGQYLRTGVTGSLRSFALFWGGSLWPLWGTLLHSVRTGRNARALVTGKDPFASLAQNPEAASVFSGAMTEIAALMADGMVRACDWSDIRRLIDVGGGHGELLVAILRANPAMRGVLFDLPQTLASATGSIETAGVGDRCELVPGSFFESVPGGGDAYLLKSVLHNWNDDRALAILAACRRAMAGQGTLLIVERVLPDRMQPSPEHRVMAASDLNMMVALAGRERTASQFGALLAAAGFRLTRIMPAAWHYSVIEGVCA